MDIEHDKLNRTFQNLEFLVITTRNVLERRFILKAKKRIVRMEEPI